MRSCVESFLRRYPQLASASGAESQCRIATTLLIDALQGGRIEAEGAWVRGHRVVPTSASPRALAANRHLVVRLQAGAFVDVTRRQYEPDCTHPRFYSSEADLACDWREIDDGPAEGPTNDERWRLLTLRPWCSGQPGKGVLVRPLRLHTWATDAESAPHHHGGLRALELPATAVTSYLEINECGSVTLTMCDDVARVARLIRQLDQRLQVRQGWSCG